uniref:Uncharacterized protein n=1 Tax=Anopheles merus TaxID=30066 RepID=A0A182UYX3_ANOME
MCGISCGAVVLLAVVLVVDDALPVVAAAVVVLVVVVVAPPVVTPPPVPPAAPVSSSASRDCFAGGGKFLISGPNSASRQGRKVRCRVWLPVAACRLLETASTSGLFVGVSRIDPSWLVNAASHLCSVSSGMRTLGLLRISSNRFIFAILSISSFSIFAIIRFSGSMYLVRARYFSRYSCSSCGFSGLGTAPPGWPGVFNEPPGDWPIVERWATPPMCGLGDGIRAGEGIICPGWDGGPCCWRTTWFEAIPIACGFMPAFAPTIWPIWLPAFILGHLLLLTAHSHDLATAHAARPHPHTHLTRHSTDHPGAWTLHLVRATHHATHLIARPHAHPVTLHRATHATHLHLRTQRVQQIGRLPSTTHLSPHGTARSYAHLAHHLWPGALRRKVLQGIDGIGHTATAPSTTTALLAAVAATVLLGLLCRRRCRCCRILLVFVLRV